MPRVLVLSDLWLPFPGGAERLMFNLARYLWQRGHHVHVLTGYEHAQQGDGPGVTINLDMPLDANGAAMIAAYIDGFQPDVIVTHHVYARAFAGLLEAMQCPIVQVVLNGPRCEFADFAVYISEHVRERSGDNSDSQMILPPPALPDVIADSHDTHGPIGFIKPIPHKGVEFFYRIARGMPSRQFLVLRGEWQDLEVLLPLPNIEFMEPVADIRDFWRRVGIVLVPSISEDAGTVGQEAALNGVPCISSKAGGLPETNAGGILLPTTRVVRWVRMIQRLDADPFFYTSVQADQLVAYYALGLPARLDLFADTIERLAS